MTIDKEKPVIVTSGLSEGSYALLCSFFNETDYRLLDCRSEDFASFHPEKNLLAAVFLEEDWAGPYGVGLVEKLYCHWQGWIAARYFISTTVTEMQTQVLHKYGVKNRLDLSLGSKVLNEVKKDLDSRCSMLPALSQVFSQLEQNAVEGDSQKIRQLVESLLFFDSELLSVMCRWLTYLLELGHTDLCDEVLQRVKKTIGIHEDMKIVSGFKAILHQSKQPEELPGLVFADASWADILLQVGKGDLFSGNAPFDWSRDDPFNKVFYKYWGERLMLRFLDCSFDACGYKKEGFITTLVEGAKNDVELTKLHASIDAAVEKARTGEEPKDTEEKPDEDDVGDGERAKFVSTFESLEDPTASDKETPSEDKDVSFFMAMDEKQKVPDLENMEPKLGEVILDLHKNTKKKEVSEAVELACQKITAMKPEKAGDDDEDASFKNVNWLFYNPDESYLAIVSQYFEELGIKNVYLSSSTEECLKLCLMHRVDGFCFAFDPDELTGLNILRIVYSFRSRSHPATVMFCYSQENIDEFNKNYNDVQVNAMNTLPETREEFEKVLRYALDNGSSRESFNKYFNSCRKGFHSKNATFFKPEYRLLNRDIKSAHDKLRNEFKLGAWVDSDLIRVHVSLDGPDDAKEIMTSLKVKALPDWEEFQAKIVIAHADNSFDSKVDGFMKEFWELEHCSVITAFNFGMALLERKRVDVLGDFLSKWSQEPKLAQDDGYLFLVYQYYKFYNRDEWAVNSLLNAVVEQPQYQPYFSSFTEELEKGEHHKELQTFLTALMTLDHVDKIECRLLLAVSYYKSNQFESGDQLLKDVLLEDFFNSKVRELVLEYEREDFVAIDG